MFYYSKWPLTLIFDHLRVSRSNTIGFRFRLSYYKYKCLHLGSFGVIQRNRMIYEEEDSVESSFGTVGSQLGTSNFNLGSDCRYHTYPRIRTLFSHKPYPSPITNTNPRPNPNKNELKVKAAKVSNNLWVIKKLATVPLIFSRRKPIQQNAMSTLHSIRIKSNQFDPFWIMTNHIRRNYEMIVSNQHIRIV